MKHIPQLVEALQRGNLALFVGADLPRDLTGRPSRADLAAKLATERLGISGSPPPWPEVAAQYEASAGRNALIRWLREQLDGCRPGPVYGLLAQLPVAVYLTTAYDPWLHEALRDAGRHPNLPVADASSLGLREPGRPTVAHLLGVYDRPESLALTAADLNQLPESKRQILAGLVHPTLANQSVLLLGQDLRDSHFQTLYQHALFQAGSIRPPAFAVWEGLADWETQTWLRLEVRVLEILVMDLLGELLGEDHVEVTDEEALGVATSPERENPPVSARPDRLAAIRELLRAAFTSETLLRFCVDRPAFRPIVDEFSAKHGLNDMIDEAITYCSKHLLLDDLLAEVQAVNPQQYDRFHDRLGISAPKYPNTGHPSDKPEPEPSHLEPVAQLPNKPELTTPIRTTMQTITWLHLSDLHFREDEAYDENIVLEALLSDLQERMEEGLRPDFIVVTGDIAFASRPAEYDMARRFFDDLLAVSGLGKDRLFLVPGNHDVDRKAISTLAAGATSILNNRRAVNQFLASEAERALVFQRFHNYADFVGGYLAPHLAFDGANYYFVRWFEVAGRSVAILGLNSAWLAASDEDRNRLLLGERQVRDALKAAESADLRLAAMHHPFDWLKDFDRDNVEPLLSRGCDFVLHGHMHSLGLLQTSGPDAETFVIAAGACYDTRAKPDRPNSYNLVRLDLGAGRGAVHLRMYSDRQGGFWTKDVVNYRNVPDGVYLFGLRDRPASR